MTAVAHHQINMDRSFRLAPRKLIAWIVLITLDLLCDGKF